MSIARAPHEPWGVPVMHEPLSSLNLWPTSGHKDPEWRRERGSMGPKEIHTNKSGQIQCRGVSLQEMKQFNVMHSEVMKTLMCVCVCVCLCVAGQILANICSAVKAWLAGSGPGAGQRGTGPQLKPDWPLKSPLSCQLSPNLLWIFILFSRNVLEKGTIFKNIYKLRVLWPLQDPR